MDEIERFLAERFDATAGWLRRRYDVDGEDAVQEALVRAWTRRDEIESISAWVRQVALNNARMTLRSRYAEERALQRLVLDPLRESRSELDGVRAAIAALPQRQAQVVVLHYYVDLSVVDIAAHLGIRTGTVKSELHRARAALARSLCEHRQAGRTTVDGWSLGPAKPGYAFELTNEEHGGKPVARLQYEKTGEDDFGMVAQEIQAARYVGQRMRLAGELRTLGVDGWAGLWFRVDRTFGDVLAFDNMEDRGLTGTTDWRRCEVVLDVSGEATRIAFGALVVGLGDLRLANLTFEQVGTDVPTTARWRGLQEEPMNLDFSA